MKGISSLLIAGGLFFVTATGFAAPTSLTSNWICTTNASSSDTEMDKAADKQMSETPKAAAEAYAYAAQHCRDCTKITCELND
ncbi:MAG: hypothetical protein Q8M40_09510 [Legionella sp.]|nr:hypothetical protein [Legionella sp.]HRD69670.1 hypothetical protein [Legionella sp.]